MSAELFAQIKFVQEMNPYLDNYLTDEVREMIKTFREIIDAYDFTKDNHAIYPHDKLHLFIKDLRAAYDKLTSNRERQLNHQRNAEAIDAKLAALNKYGLDWVNGLEGRRVINSECNPIWEK